MLFVCAPQSVPCHNLHGEPHLQVRANGLIIFVPKFGIEGPVYLTAKGAPPSASGTAAVGESDFLLDEEKQTVKSKDGKTSFTVSLLVAVSRYWSESEDRSAFDAGNRLRLAPAQVFDKVAVRITIVEGTGHRRHLSLELIERSELPASEQMS